jgi:hypothetical protein
VEAVTTEPQPPADDETPAESAPGRPPPLQFSLRGLMGVVTAVAVLFAALRWMGASTTASAVVLAVLMLAAAAGVGLLFAIAGRGGSE